MDLPQNQTISFEAAQSLGEHFLRYSPDLALEHGVAARSSGKNMNDQRGPLISDPAENHA